MAATDHHQKKKLNQEKVFYFLFILFFIYFVLFCFVLFFFPHEKHSKSIKSMLHLPKPRFFSSFLSSLISSFDHFSKKKSLNRFCYFILVIPPQRMSFTRGFFFLFSFPFPFFISPSSLLKTFLPALIYLFSPNKNK